MALILDKTHTGVTSVDISGNTLTTGYTNIDFQDQYGNIHNDPYMVIDNIIIDKSIFNVRVIMHIYKDSTAREESKSPLVEEGRYINDEELYNQYFSIENMDNNNVFKAAYDFIQIEHYPSWKSDEI